MRDNREITRVLFVCVHNSARSQMAEAFLNSLGEGRFLAMSAGLEPGVLNPLAVEAMREVGLDISKNPVKSVFDVYRSGALFSYVVAVCDAEAAQRCPTFPGITRKIAWSLPDPASFTGTWEERLARTRGVRNSLKAHVEELIRNESQAARPSLDTAVKTPGK